MVKMAHFDVIMTTHVEIASHWNLKSASIVMLDINNSLGLGDKTTMKSDMKGLKVVQMLVFG